VKAVWYDGGAQFTKGHQPGIPIQSLMIFTSGFNNASID
jgi:hypothetical protein